MPFIYVDVHVHLKTILAVTLFSIFYEGCARGSCVRRWSLLQDCLPMKFQDVKFKDPKLMNFHEYRHEAFILFKLFHNLFAINFFRYQPDFRKLSMKTYLYRASNLKSTITFLALVS